MAFEEPPHLSVGTEVSAKYRGAFCEAKVNKIDKSIKCWVLLKDTGGRIMVMDDAIKGQLKVGATVEVSVPNVADPVPATLQKITDNSLYTVVFDDGDESTLRRTQLCLKGEKHFVKSDTLDELPLTNPEHFGTPVMKNTKAYKRKRSGGGGNSASDDDSSDEDEDGASSSSHAHAGYPCDLQPLLGRVVLMSLDERGRRYPITVPALVVRPGADGDQLPAETDLLVKSFKDSKFCIVSSKLSQPFTREVAVKNEDKATKAAFEKALLYFDTQVLPQGWLRDELLGSDSDAGEISECSDSEVNEERDLFVAQLYKFMDDRGTPINKAPIVSGHDLNLYRLFRLVDKLGGYNRVTNQMKWRLVYSKMHLPVSATAANQLKTAYKKFLHAFEDFYRKLGSSMGTISRPGARGRHSSSSSHAGRTILSFRDRDAGPRSPRSSSGRRSGPSDEKQAECGEEVKVEVPAEEAEKAETRLDSRVKCRQSIGSSSSTNSNNPETDTTDEPSELHRVTKPVTAIASVKKATPAVVDSPKRRVPLREGRKVRPETRGGGKRENEDVPPPEEIVTRAKAEVVMKVEDVVEKAAAVEKRPVRSAAGGRAEEDSSDTESKDEEPRRAKSRRLKKKTTEDDAEKGVKKAPPLRKRASSEVTSDASSVETTSKSGDADEKRDAKEEREHRFDSDIVMGSKLRVKYGRGRDQKIYEAKVVVRAKENGVQHYRVHYDGWNKRYDEWVRRERIVSIVYEPPPKVTVQTAASKAKTPVAKMPLQRKKSSPIPNVVFSHAETPVSTPKSRTTSTNAARPTRSNCIEQSLATGLPATRIGRTRRGSGFMETTDVQSHESESEDAASSSEDAEEEATVTASEDTLSNDVMSEEEEKMGSPLVTLATEMTRPVSDNDDVDTDGESSVESVVEPRVLRSRDDTKSAVSTVAPIKIPEEVMEQEDVPKETGQSKPFVDETKVDEAAEAERESSDGEKSIEVNVTDTDDHSLEAHSSELEDVVVDEPEVTPLQEEPMKVEEPEEAEEGIVESEVEKEETDETVDVKEEMELPELEVDKAADVDDQESTEDESKALTVSDVCKEEPPVVEESTAETLQNLDEKPDNVEALDDDQDAEAAVVASKEEPTKEMKGKEGEEKVEETLKKTKVKTRRKDAKAAKQYRQMLEAEATKAEDIDDASSLDSAEMVKPKPRKRARLTVDNSDDVTEKTPKAKVKAKTKVGRKKKILVVAEPDNDENATPATATATAKSEDKPSETSSIPFGSASPQKSSEVSDDKITDQPAPYDNTPPDTPERPSPGQQDEAFCTPSEHEANQEVASLMAQLAEGSESPMACDVSTCGSSGNAPSSECEEPLSALRGGGANAGMTQAGATTAATEMEKKRKRAHKRAGGEKKQRQSKHDATDSDEADDKSDVTPSTQTSSSASPDKVVTMTTSCDVVPHGARTPRPSKYNFIESLEEGKYLEGENRIEFLVGKIQEMRNVYMQLKAEVACIDRRRKRHHRRERNAASATTMQQENSPVIGSDAL